MARKGKSLAERERANNKLASVFFRVYVGIDKGQYAKAVNKANFNYVRYMTTWSSKSLRAFMKDKTDKFDAPMRRVAYAILRYRAGTPKRSGGRR